MRPETEYCGAAASSVTTRRSESVEGGKATRNKDTRMQAGEDIYADRNTLRAKSLQNSLPLMST